MKPIYLDHHATTPVASSVADALIPLLSEEYGNAASITHVYGWSAAERVDRARKVIADLIGAAPREIVFTSGATESDNLALLGVAAALENRGRHIITATTEHKAVLDTVRYLATIGYEVTDLSVDATGRIDLGELEASIRPDTILISLMAANNEIGTLHPIRAIGAIAKERNVVFHTDAAQLLAHLPVDVDADNVDLLSISGHKMYGPKGIGALYVRSGTPIVGQIHGGGHENGVRSGTLNVPGIVGLAAAAELAESDMEHESGRLTRLRDLLYMRIESELEGVRLNGHPEFRLPNNLNLSFEHVDAQLLLNRLRTVVAASTGSACTSATPEPSHVLKEIGLPHDLSYGSVRFGLGRGTTTNDIETVAEAVIREVHFLRTHATESNQRQ